jgi:predicted small secreted protein
MCSIHPPAREALTGTRRPIMYSRFIAILLALAALGLTACNTMQGVGEDIERGGEKLQDSAKKAKD